MALGAAIADRRADEVIEEVFCCGRISPVLADFVENSKIEQPRKSRKSAFLAESPLQDFVMSIRSPVIVFGVIDVAPHIAARKTYQRP